MSFFEEDRIGKLSFVTLLAAITAAIFYVPIAKNDFNQREECRVAIDDASRAVAAWMMVKQAFDTSSLPNAYLNEDQSKVRNEIVNKKMETVKEKCSHTPSK